MRERIAHTNKLLLPALAALAFALAIGLSACGGQSKEGEGEKTPDYEVKSFDLGAYFSVEVYNDEVVFDSAEECDVLLVYVKATNNSDEARAFGDSANINTYGSDGKNLRWSYIEGDDGKPICDPSADDVKKIEPGESMEFVYGWEIESYDTARVNFGGYTVATEDTDVEFDLSGRQTEKAKAAQEKAEAELAAKKETSEVNLPGCTIALAEGWYVDSSDDKKAKLRNDTLENGYIEVNNMTLATSAQEESEKLNRNYGGGLSIDTVTIGSQDFYHLKPAPTQFLLLADESETGHVIKIYGMFLTMDQAADQLAQITIK